MIPGTGRWLGRGSLIADGQSLGRTLEAEVQVEREEGALQVHGQWTLAGDAPMDCSIRIVQSDTGTWTIGARVGALRLQGTAKLDSPPSLALLWNEPGSLHLAVTLFALPDGLGLRGFARDGQALYTWEVALRPRQDVLGGENVVTLQRRRPR